MVVDRAERLVHLDVLTLRQALDDARLDAVLKDRARSLRCSEGPSGKR